MNFFLNPIGVTAEQKRFISMFRAAIITVVFVILLSITVHMAKKDRSIKKLIPLIIADCLVMALVIAILILLGDG